MPRGPARILSSLLPLALVSLASCAPEATPTPTLSWDRALPPSDVLTAPAARGLRVVRGIIHLHSVYSHDACDNDPRPGGKGNAPCAQHLRQGLCQTRQDFALLTDHATHMVEAPFADLLLREPGDDAVAEDGELTASRLRCDEGSGAPGHKVLLAPGGENALMPVALRRHLADTEAERRARMTAETPEAVAAFHKAGGLVLVPHGESRSLPLLRALSDAGLDGMEIYNLHANIDPRIRADHLGLAPLGAAEGLIPWLNDRPPAEGGPQPDLALLGFLEDNRAQLGRYDTLLGEGRRLHPVLGSDIHENAVKQLLTDGERGDSYRRLMRSFSNHLLVPAGGALQPEDLRQALRQGRGYGAFEVFGTPVGLDYHADTPAGLLEIGGAARAPATLRLFAPRPTLPPGASPAPAQGPVLRLRILRVAPQATEAVEVASLQVSDAAGGAAELRHVATAPGAYRAEVRITPRHLLPLLGEDADRARFQREYPYLYTGPIYVSP
jgi:hypothetical protein